MKRGRKRRAVVRLEAFAVEQWQRGRRADIRQSKNPEDRGISYEVWGEIAAEMHGYCMAMIHAEEDEAREIAGFLRSMAYVHSVITGDEIAGIERMPQFPGMGVL